MRSSEGLLTAHLAVKGRLIIKTVHKIDKGLITKK